jgi:hypothetical protein
LGYKPVNIREGISSKGEYQHGGDELVPYF